MWIGQTFGRAVVYPCHWLPSTQSFVDASLAGLGWALNPISLVRDHLAAGRLVEQARRARALRGLRFDADRGLGRQYGHPYLRAARLRHQAHLRAGHRARAPPPLLRPGPRDGPLRRRIRRYHGHRRAELLRPGDQRPGQDAARGGPGPRRPPRPRRARDHLPPRRRRPRRAAGRAAGGRLLEAGGLRPRPPTWASRPARPTATTPARTAAT